MNNSEKPAFATASPQTDKYDSYLQEGLTKREYFAAMAMQGLISNPNIQRPRDGSWHTDMVAFSKRAINYADALLKELEAAE